jgi:hypothetical protein
MDGAFVFLAGILPLLVYKAGARKEFKPSTIRRLFAVVCVIVIGLCFSCQHRLHSVDNVYTSPTGWEKECLHAELRGIKYLGTSHVDHKEGGGAT